MTGSPLAGEHARRRVAMAVVALLLVASCGQAYSTVFIDATPEPDSPPSKPAAMATGSRSTSVLVLDDVGDLVNGEDEPVAGPAYIDVTGVDARVLSGGLQISIGLAGAMPVTLPFDDEPLSYTVVIKTTDAPDDVGYWWSYENRADGSFSSSVTTFDPTGTTPGNMVSAGQTLVGLLPLEDLGDPTTIRLCVLTQQSSPDLEVLAEDNVPGDSCLGLRGPWLELAVGT